MVVPFPQHPDVEDDLLLAVEELLRRVPEDGQRLGRGNGGKWDRIACVDYF